MMPLDLDALATGSIPLVLGAVGTLWVCFVLGRALYNITLHPLSGYPGPKLWGAFSWPHMAMLFFGSQVPVMRNLHEKYGSVVRIRPNALSYTDGRAWKDIYGSRPGKGQMQKSRGLDASNKMNKLPPHMLIANDADHTRQRRLLAHAFSDQALRSQESILNKYFQLLVSKLREEIDGPNNGTVDMVAYYNFTTFDIIGDLAFGESFGALEAAKYHPWIANTFKFVVSVRWLRLATEYALVRWGFRMFAAFATQLSEARTTHLNFTTERVEKRLNAETDRKDFITYILRHNDEKGMSHGEIISNSSVLILAGSETTATLLSGVTYHLLRNPEKLALLQNEVRSAFSTSEEMTLLAVNQLPYLQAVIEEGLRMYPPVPGALPRKTPPEGAMVAGKCVAGNTDVGVHHMSAYRDPGNFTEPDVFAPERFLANCPENYAHDNKAAMQPFSYGPRNCLGKNLAYNEMKSILARIVFEFNMDLCAESQDWTNHTAITLWQKPSLMVKLRPSKLK